MVRDGLDRLALVRWFAESRESFPSNNPEETAIYREQARQLIEALPEKFSIVIWLRFGYGYTVPEMAEITGKPLSTLCNHVKRAEYELITSAGR